MDRIKMGNYLAELRKSRDLSQVDLAEIMGVTFQAVSKWERGEAIPDISILEKLALFYSITIDSIVRGEEIKKDVIPPIIEQKEAFDFLHQKRIYGFWISIAYFIIFLLIGLCPFVSASYFFDGHTIIIKANYYQVVFSSDFRLTNFFFLLQFFITLVIIALTMLFYVCKRYMSFKKLYFARLILIILHLATLITNIVVLEKTGLGNFLIILIILCFDVLYLTLKVNRKKYLKDDFKA